MRALLLVPLLVTAIPSAGTLAAPSMQVWVVSDTVRVPQTAPAGHGASASLYGARNETVSFQIMVRANGDPISDVVPRPSRLTARGGHAIPASSVHLYRETYQNVTTPSDSAGQKGIWPDGLIPIGRDPIVGEVRNGAPFTVAAGRTQGVWVDLSIPPGQPAGAYTGTITLSSAKRPPRSVPVRLTVWSFSLPVQPSLPTAFGFDTWDAYRGHFGSTWDTARIERLTNLYSEAALQMRLSMYGIDVSAPDYAYNSSSGRIPRIDWSTFDATAVPAYDGKLDPLHRRFTARALPVPDNLSDPTHNHNAEDVAFWRAVAAHYAARRWLSRSYLYYDDEPSSAADFATARLHAQLLHRANPHLRFLLTTHYRADLAGTVNIWTPIINEIDTPGNPSMATYRRRQAAGDQVWWYDSDSSADRGQWPDMFTDHPAMNQRIMAWMTWRYGLQGFLYYDTVYAYPRTNPWSNVYEFGTNGDGTLFYPGKPSVIGGRTDIPCFSIRLLLIRQSLQDYEYMHLLAQRGRRALVDSLVRSVVRSSSDFDHDPSRLLHARLVMGQALNGGH
jgi:hypothetical protein